MQMNIVLEIEMGMEMGMEIGKFLYLVRTLSRNRSRIQRTLTPYLGLKAVQVGIADILMVMVMVMEMV